MDSRKGNIDDQHRNTNMNDKDHLVGQLATRFPALLPLGLEDMNVQAYVLSLDSKKQPEALAIPKVS